MEIRLNNAQEEEVSRLASSQGRTVEEVVRDLVTEGLRTEEYYRVKLQRSIAQADRAEFVEEEEMDRPFQAMLHRS